MTLVRSCDFYQEYDIVLFSKLKKGAVRKAFAQFKNT